MYKILQSQVIETFQYIEPVSDNKDTYSLRYHQLYGNICAEIETNFRGILKANGYARVDDKGRTVDEARWAIDRDFFKVNSALKLHEYEIESSCCEISNSSTDTTKPFDQWSAIINTGLHVPLPWWRDHNAVKHYRSADFKRANLKNVLTALAGLYILLSAQFGFLVDSVTNKSVMQAMTTGGEWITVTNNEMGYMFKQTPTWSDPEKYDFDWNLIKASNSPFDMYQF